MHLELDVDTFRGDVKLAALGDLDSLSGFVAAGGFESLNFVYNLVALEDLTEDNVTAIEPAE